MKFVYFLKFLSLVTFVSVEAVDWCTLTSCATNSHIACNNDGSWSSSCISPVQVKLTDAQIQYFLDLHNIYRNKVALGQLPQFKTAAKMAQVTWNSQLTTFAELNTKKCNMAHDSCHNTENLKYSGQNLAFMATTGTYTIEKVINGSLAMWFNEEKYANMDNIINKEGTSSGGKVIGHFTALVTDRSNEIGCAMSTYRYQNGGGWWNAYLVACNYASTNIVGWPVYKSGPVASSCTKGADTKYKGLCKTTEPINPNVQS